MLSHDGNRALQNNNKSILNKPMKKVWMQNLGLARTIFLSFDKIFLIFVATAILKVFFFSRMDPGDVMHLENLFLIA